MPTTILLSNYSDLPVSKWRNRAVGRGAMQRQVSRTICVPEKWSAHQFNLREGCVESHHQGVILPWSTRTGGYNSSDKWGSWGRSICPEQCLIHRGNAFCVLSPHSVLCLPSCFLMAYCTMLIQLLTKNIHFMAQAHFASFHLFCILSQGLPG